MGAEIFDVEVNFNGVLISYATKISSKKNKDTSTTLTFNGDVNVRAKNTGGTITLEGLVWPSSVQEANDLEDMLNTDKPIESITCTGTAYTVNGDSYIRTIEGLGVTVTSDEDEWSPSDGISQKLEFSVNNLNRRAE